MTDRWDIFDDDLPEREAARVAHDQQARDELDERRIRHVMHERLARLRARSRAVVLGLFAGVALPLFLIRAWQPGPRATRLAAVAIASLALFMLMRSVRRLRAPHRTVRKVVDEQRTPSFDGLADGTKLARPLEAMQER